MKCLGESSCLIFELSKMEFGSYLEKFGEYGWLDIENMVCLPNDYISQLNSFARGKLENFLNQDISNKHVIIKMI